MVNESNIVDLQKVLSIWNDTHLTITLQCIDVLELLIADLVYELNEHGGYDILDDVISVAEDTITKLRTTLS